MSLKDTLTTDVATMFRTGWQTQDAAKVPDADDVKLNQNHAKVLADAVVLYADLHGSTALVDEHTWHFAAETYKAYLRCAAQIIKKNGGTITAYDGDRVMAIFVEGAKNTSAVASALELNWAVFSIIRPLSLAQYNNSYYMTHSVGIDRSELRAVKMGVRNDNEITWVGRAANHAAKLCNLTEFPLWITDEIYSHMLDETKFDTRISSGTNMWAARNWTPMKNRHIHGSNYTRTL